MTRNKSAKCNTSRRMPVTYARIVLRGTCDVRRCTAEKRPLLPQEMPKASPKRRLITKSCLSEGSATASA